MKTKFIYIRSLRSGREPRLIKNIHVVGKKYLLLLSLAFMTACDSDNFNNRNPYIPNYNFSVEINMSLPQYSQLQFPSNAFYYPNEGVRGIIIFNTGSGYNAFDAACPNQELQSCSTMDIDGIMAVCPCDEAQYNLFDGQSPGMEYPMKGYRVEVNGSVLRIYN
jgi:nitrite reductase/ring-hydroxylating ferredoxin subunit